MPPRSPQLRGNFSMYRCGRSGEHTLGQRIEFVSEVKVRDLHSFSQRRSVFFILIINLTKITFAKYSRTRRQLSNTVQQAGYPS